jgi:hypothetical protein
MLTAILSSELQTIFMPPETFSIFIVQRGTMTVLIVPGMPVACPGIVPIMPPMPGIPIVERSIIIVFIMTLSSCARPTSTAGILCRTPAELAPIKLFLDRIVKILRKWQGSGR